MSVRRGFTQLGSVAKPESSLKAALQASPRERERERFYSESDPLDDRQAAHKALILLKQFEVPHRFFS